MDDLLEKSKDSGISSLSFQESDDISEHAQVIGHMFESVIKEFDLGDKMNPLMKYVIFVLEQMNLMIQEKDELQNQIFNLENQLNQCFFESKENKADRLRCQKEFEQIEDGYRNENTELLNLISTLKDENSKLRMNMFNKQKTTNLFEDEKPIKETDGVENMLIKEKKKVKNLQKELEDKNILNLNIENQLEQECKKIEILNKNLQRFKEENLILNQQIEFKHNENEKQLELIKEVKNLLQIVIKDHIDEHENQCSPNRTPNHHSTNELKIKDEFVERQKNHLNQLQKIQKLIEFLSVAVETVTKTNDKSEFDKIEFQKHLNDKLARLEQEQEQQSKRLISVNSTPIDSPSQFCSLESNCSIVSKSPKHLNNEPQSKFTLNEIRNILLERNSLQNQVKYLEKQLFSFKKFQSNKSNETYSKDNVIKKDDKDGLIDKKIIKVNSIKNNEIKNKSSKQKANNSNSLTENFKQLAESTMKKSINNDHEVKRTRYFSEADECLPVEGPLPKEPDEKLYPTTRRRSSNSPLLKFFPLLKINRNK